MVEEYNKKAQSLRLEKKDYTAAIEMYSKVIELRPNYEYAYFRRGYCKGLVGDLKGQVEDYSKHIELEPTADNYVSRALIKNKLEDYQGVIDDCTKAIKLKKKHSFAHRFRGEAKFKLNDFLGAITDLDVPIAIEDKKKPDNLIKVNLSLFISLKYRGLSWVAVKEFEKALEDFNRMIALHSADPISYKLRADAKLKSGNIQGYLNDMLLFREKDFENQKKGYPSLEDRPY